MNWDSSLANSIIKIKHNEEVEHIRNALKVDYNNEIFAATARSNILDGGLDVILIDDMSDNELATSTVISDYDFSYKEFHPYNEESSSNYTYYYWNYTTGDNSLNVTKTANDWNDPVELTYNNTTLTKAIKLESSTSLVFTVEKTGDLTLVTYSKNSSPTINLTVDGVTTAYSISTSGSTTISLSAGTYTLTKGTTNTYLYLLELMVVNSALDYNKNVYYDSYNQLYIVGTNSSLVLDYSNLLSSVINEELYPITTEDTLVITPYISNIYFLLNIENAETPVQVSLTVGNNLYTLVNGEIVNIDYSEYNLDTSNYKLTITNNNSSEVYLKNLALGIEINEMITISE